MHSHLLESDDIDYNLYPALLQVFSIILIGYLAGCFELITKAQALGLNKFVGTFALPALLFRSIAILDFSSVNWLFLTSIFLSKLTVFVTVIVMTLLTLRPMNVGLAAVFGIFVSQSNDFALGYPIVDAIYSESHPDYLHYIYLIAPISLCILNPIAFLMMEANEALYNNKKAKEKLNKSEEGENNDDSDKSDQETVSDRENDDQDTLPSTTAGSTTNESNSCDLERIEELTSHSITKIIAKSQQKKTSPEPFSTQQLIRTTIWSTISNPIVFMTLIGIVANFILKQHIPSMIDPILLTLSNSFSALALFYLGYSMVGKIKNLKFNSIVIIIILIFIKSLIYPLINREIILHLIQNVNPKSNDTETLSTFGFLYGTFPAAPSLFFYIARYKSIGDDLISAALVFGTLASAPLMMISGKMISLKYNSSEVSNFEDIECKTAYGFSILSWFCCLWVLYILLASGRGFLKSHRFLSLLLISQMVNSLIHIIWSNMSSNVSDLSDIWGYLHVLFGLFFAFITRCLPLSMLFSVINMSGISHRTRTFQLILKLSKSNIFLYFVGIGLPLFAVLLCIAIGHIPKNQSMIISIAKEHIIVANVLLLLVVLTVSYILVMFVRTRNEQNSFLQILKHKTGGRRAKRNRNHYSFANYEDEPTTTSSIINNGNLSQSNNRVLVNNLSINNVSINDIEQRSGFIHNRNLADPNDSENGEDSQQLIMNKSGQDYVYIFDQETDMDKLKNDYQIIQQISLIVILTFNSLMCFFFQMWVLFDESKSGVFYELQLIDITLLYGQGFFTFLIFGLDNDYIFAPVLFKIKELLRLIKPYQPVPMDQVPRQTTEICRKFEEKYKSKCIEDIVRNQRFHYKFYLNVFKGNEFVNWLVKQKFVKSRKQGEELGKKLIQGRVIHHVSNKQAFFDSFHLYKFDSLL